jgi:hypothetical protein
MRRLMMMFGVILLSATTFVGASAVSVSANTEEFVANKTGKTTGKQVNPQVFKTGAGTIECTTVTSTGKIEAPLNFTAHKEVLTYSGCSGFGVALTMTPAHFEFLANKTAKLEKTVTISSESLTCKVLLEPQTLNSVNYTNSSGKLIASATVTGIHSIPTGGTCGSTENTEGSYSGKIEAELESGTIEWKS